jgi:hypothetical protein
MQKAIPARKIIALAGCSGVILLCVLVLVYEISARNEAPRCYQHIAQKWNVSPTYQAVRDAVNAQIQTDLVPGTSRDEVVKKLSRIAPVVMTPMGSTANDGTMEKVELKICSYYGNDLFFGLISWKMGI